MCVCSFGLWGVNGEGTVLLYLWAADAINDAWPLMMHGWSWSGGHHLLYLLSLSLFPRSVYRQREQVVNGEGRAGWTSGTHRFDRMNFRQQLLTWKYWSVAEGHYSLFLVFSQTTLWPKAKSKCFLQFLWKKRGIWRITLNYELTGSLQGLSTLAIN